jgi:hypothetical protein
MKQFYCQCGQAVFFDSERCLRCGARLGFDPASMSMLALQPRGNRWQAPDGSLFRLCDNTLRFDVCNWIVPAEESQALCRGCQFNRTVPNQSVPANRLRWQRLEEGKKRLLYTLMQLGLPLENGWEAPDRGLLLDFIEDERSNEAYPETFVTTGYLGGVITINVLEADDAARETQRLQMNETYRTVLGHLRHESGHYYWQWLQPEQDLLQAFRGTFGDERSNYREALEHYYAEGAQPDWSAHFISAYASAHPAEDWAESWGHYLHIYDALETAAAHGLTQQWPGQMDIAERIAAWRSLSITLNELNRSVGRRDAYPFLLNTEVEKKLAFVDQVIRRLQTLPRETEAGQMPA